MLSPPRARLPNSAGNQQSAFHTHVLNCRYFIFPSELQPNGNYIHNTGNVACYRQQERPLFQPQQSCSNSPTQYELANLVDVGTATMRLADAGSQTDAAGMAVMPPPPEMAPNPMFPPSDMSIHHQEMDYSGNTADSCIGTSPLPHASTLISVANSPLGCEFLCQFHWSGNGTSSLETV